MGFIVPEPMWDPVIPDIDPSDWEDDDDE